MRQDQSREDVGTKVRWHMGRGTTVWGITVWGILSLLAGLLVGPHDPVNARDRRDVNPDHGRVNEVEVVADEVAVRFNKGVSEAARRAFAKRHNLERMRRIPVIGVVRYTIRDGIHARTKIRKVRKEPEVSEAFLDPLLEPRVIPDDPRYAELWGMEDINMPAAWDIRTDATPVIIAVVDSGVDYNHPDLADNIYINPGEDGVSGELRDNGIDDDGNGYIDDWHGWDFSGINKGLTDFGTNDPKHGDPHGTHVAGTAGAVGNNGVGVTGVPWNVRILPVRIAERNGNARFLDQLEGFIYAVRMGAKVLSTSYGAELIIGRNQPLVDLAREVVTWVDEQGALLSGAAGNAGADLDKLQDVPAGLGNPNIISAAAVDDPALHGGASVMVDWSNFGPRSVHIAAPGVNILSTIPRNKYQVWEGTSMAQPHVAGAMALVMSEFPSLTHRQIRDRILMSSGPLPQSDAQKLMSRGRLDVAAALAQDFSPPDPITDLDATLNGFTVDMSWTATPDAGVGTRQYDLRKHDQLITLNNFDDAERQFGLPDPNGVTSFPPGLANPFPPPAAPGTLETYSFNIKGGDEGQFMVRVFDGAGNLSRFSNQFHVTAPTVETVYEELFKGSSTWTPIGNENKTGPWHLDGEFTPDGEDAYGYGHWSEELGKHATRQKGGRATTDFAYLVSPVYDLGVASEELLVRINYALSITYSWGDRCYLEISSDGTNWEGLDWTSMNMPLSRTAYNYLRAANGEYPLPNTAGWYESHDFPIPAVYQNQPIQLRFQLKVGSLSYTAGYSLRDGLFVENVKIVKVTAPGSMNVLPSDTIRPGDIDSLISSEVGHSTARLSFIAPGDDGGLGTVAGYDVRIDTEPIPSGVDVNGQEIERPHTDFAQVEPAVLVEGGSEQTLRILNLQADTQYYYSIKAFDETGYRSANDLQGTLTTGAATPLFNMTDWTSEGATSEWHISTLFQTPDGQPTWRYGQDVVDANGNYRYLANTEGSLVSPIVENTVPGDDLSLNFDHLMKAESRPYDFGRLLIRDASTGDETFLRHFDFTSGMNYHPVNVDLSQFAGTRFQVVIHFVSDAYVLLQGWNIGHLQVNWSTATSVEPCPDSDGDGYAASCTDCTNAYCPVVDCNDSDAAESPGAIEGPPGDLTCTDTKDNDCDGDADALDFDCICDNDGFCDIDEDCTTCPGDCISGTIPDASCGNGVCEAGDGESCLSCPEDCNGTQSGKPSRRYCCGDGSGTNPVCEGDARCEDSGNSCTTTPVVPGSYCCGDDVCELAEDDANCLVDCGVPVKVESVNVTCSQSGRAWEGRAAVRIVFRETGQGVLFAVVDGVWSGSVNHGAAPFRTSSSGVGTTFSNASGPGSQFTFTVSNVWCDGLTGFACIWDPDGTDQFEATSPICGQ